MRIACHRPVRSAVGITVALIALQSAPASAIPSQTLTDPVGDNCRVYPGVGSICGPDITQVVFSTPGDGSLHIDVTYASLPTNVYGTSQIPELPEYVEVGMYPKSATAPDVVPGIYRVSKWGSAPTAPWKLQLLPGGPIQLVGDVAATVRPLGIDLGVPLAALGDPVGFRYAVNAGSYGEMIPEHPELAPNTGLFDLTAGAPSQPPAGSGTPPAPGQPAPTPVPAIKKLSGIAGRQRGTAITGTVELTVPGDLTIDALVPAATLAAKSKPKSIGRVTRRGLKAGAVRFSVPLRASARKRLAGRRTQVTLRLALKPISGATVTQIRKLILTVRR